MAATPCTTTNSSRYGSSGKKPRQTTPANESGNGVFARGGSASPAVGRSADLSSRSSPSLSAYDSSHSSSASGKRASHAPSPDTIYSGAMVAQTAAVKPRVLVSSQYPPTTVCKKTDACASQHEQERQPGHLLDMYPHLTSKWERTVSNSPILSGKGEGSGNGSVFAHGQAFRSLLLSDSHPPLMPTTTSTAAAATSSAALPYHVGTDYTVRTSVYGASRVEFRAPTHEQPKSTPQAEAPKPAPPVCSSCQKQGKRLHTCVT